MPAGQFLKESVMAQLSRRPTQPERKLMGAPKCWKPALAPRVEPASEPCVLRKAADSYFLS